MILEEYVDRKVPEREKNLGGYILDLVNQDSSMFLDAFGMKEGRFFKLRRERKLYNSVKQTLSELNEQICPTSKIHLEHDKRLSDGTVIHPLIDLGWADLHCSIPNYLFNYLTKNGSVSFPYRAVFTRKGKNVLNRYRGILGQSSVDEGIEEWREILEPFEAHDTEGNFVGWAYCDTDFSSGNISSKSSGL